MFFSKHKKPIKKEDISSFILYVTMLHFKK